MARPKYFPIEMVVAMLKSRVVGTTQRKLAAQLGVSNQYVSDVFSGARVPTREMLDLIGMERVVTYRVARQRGNSSSSNE